jgi:AraC-like DNA-binding protein
LLLIAALLLREHARATVARLGAAFAIGTCAYVVCSAPALNNHASEWTAPLQLLAGGNSVLLWLLAGALFDEQFQLNGWHGVAWCAMGALSLMCSLHWFTPPLSVVLSTGRLVSSLAFAALALMHTVSSWRADLLEQRRRLRLFVVVAAALHLGITNLAGWLLAPGNSAPLWGIANVLVLFLITSVIVWQLLRTDLHAFLPPSEAVSSPEEGDDSYTSPSVLAEIERVMKREQIYLEGNLTIGTLAGKLGLLEYKLRRIINQGLGYRNFNTFLNHHRIEHAKGMLTAHRHATTSVLTVAMECGFQSLGPFNRAFKAQTGMTPTEYRRARPADSKIG